jgi:deazaflavin-dependent oxidoreductase (nitroreductase family)
MGYLKPKPFEKHVFNRLAMRFGISGAHALIVRRRKTGERQAVPVIPVDHDGALYIVSARGESDWVRNLRAAGGGELRSKAGGEQFTAVELEEGQRAPVIAAYRAKAGNFVEKYWKELPDAGDHPVFRVEPAG